MDKKKLTPLLGVLWVIFGLGLTYHYYNKGETLIALLGILIAILWTFRLTQGRKNQTKDNS